jgi:hypothetical protein
MFYKNDALMIVSGEERSHVKVHHGSGQSGFLKASTIFQNSLLKSIKDPNP